MKARRGNTRPSRLVRLWHDRRGAAAVEFAIISTVLIALCVGVVDFGRTLYVKNQLSFLADKAARKVLISPDITDTLLNSELLADFTAGTADDLTVTVSTDTVDGIPFRIITIAYPITLFVPNLASDTLQLDVTRRVPVG